MATQRYLLDFDDILAQSFFTNANATVLIGGVNSSGTTAVFDVGVGGLGNNQFAQGQTLIFDGAKIVSSGVGPAVSTGPLENDDRYYTKSEVDAFFASLNSVGGFPVAYGNLTGVPALPLQLAFLTPTQFYSGTSVMSSPVELPMTPITGHKVVAALITVTCSLGGPNSSPPASFQVRQNLGSTPINAGYFWAAGGGDLVAGCTASVVPVDPTAQSFFYQQVGNSTSGAITATLIGVMYQ